jgi:hypothetical protein
VVAVIAYQDLSQRSAKAKAVLDEILDQDPEGRETVRQAAVWPDEIRNLQPETKPWHFVDIPFRNGGAADPPLPDEPHVLSKMAEMSNLLENRTGTPKEQADQVSWLFHLFGDVHQPLHCIDHVTPLHPQGDRGGNSFKLRGQLRNLHSLWDNSLNLAGPLRDAETLADEVMTLHPRESLQQELEVANPEQWARASYQLAVSEAYTLEENPQNPPQPSTAYRRNATKIARKQVALAGYRLADRLIQLWGP